MYIFLVVELTIRMVVLCRCTKGLVTLQAIAVGAAAWVHGYRTAVSHVYTQNTTSPRKNAWRYFTKMNTIHLSPPAYACTNEHARGGFHGTAPALLAAPKLRCAAEKVTRLSLKMNC